MHSVEFILKLKAGAYRLENFHFCLLSLKFSILNLGLLKANFKMDSKLDTYMYLFTENIVTFSSELKMFLKNYNEIFDVENVFTFSNQVKLAVLTLYISKNKLLEKSEVDTYQKVVK